MMIVRRTELQIQGSAGRIRGPLCISSTCTIGRLAWFLGTALAVMILAAPLHAASNDWAEGLLGDSTGATRDYYNRAGLLKWKHTMGDWRDAGNIEQGPVPYAVSTVLADRRARFVEWDVTELVREWLAGKYPNQGIFLRAIQGGGTCMFRSRQWDEREQRPQLEAFRRAGPDHLSRRGRHLLGLLHVSGFRRAPGTARVARKRQCPGALRIERGRERGYVRPGDPAFVYPPPIREWQRADRGLPLCPRG